MRSEIYFLLHLQQHQDEDRRPLVTEDGSVNTRQGEVEGGAPAEEEVRENTSEFITQIKLNLATSALVILIS